MITKNIEAYERQQEKSRFVEIAHTWELYSEVGHVLYFFSEETARFWLDTLTDAFGDVWNIRIATPLTVH